MRRTLNATAYSYLVAALVREQRSGITRPQLAEATGLSDQLLGRLLAQLRARGTVPARKDFNEVIHIASWSYDKAGRATLRRYALGPGVDAPQPKMTRAQIASRYYLRKKIGVRK